MTPQPDEPMMSAISLVEALPDLVRDAEAALLRIGRGDIVDQLREVEVERWTYDDFADAAYLYLKSPRVAAERTGIRRPAETVAVYDEVEINLDTDEHGRLARIEILGAGAMVAQLEARLT